MIYSVANLLIYLFALLSAVSTGAPATIDSNGDPTWLPYHEINTTDHSARILRIVSNPTAVPFSGTMDTVFVVNARETIIGCYRFTDYLSPDFRTIFVFDQHIGDPFYNLSEFVKSLGTSQTQGAWYIETDEHYGEIYSRKIAFDFIRAHGGKPQTLFGVNCDIHPVAEGFFLRQTLPEVFGELFNFMKNETALRAHGSSQIANREVGRMSRPIFATIPVTLEQTPFTHNSMYDAWVHGNDVSGFRTEHHCVKPSSLAGQPWLDDVLEWPEAHAILLNFTLLEQYADQYFSTVQYLAEEKVLPRMIDRYNLTIVRANEVVVLFDLVQFPDGLLNPAYNETRNPFPMDDMLLRNYEILALARTPMRLNSTMFDIAERPVGVALWDTFGPAFYAARIQPHWVPSTVENATLVDDEGVGRRFWRAQMMIGGYYENQSNPDTTVRTYSMFKVFPTSYLFTVGKGYKYFGTLIQNGVKTAFYSNDWMNYTFGSESVCATIECLNQMRLNSLESLTITISRGSTLPHHKIVEPHRLSAQVGPLNESFIVVQTGSVQMSLYRSQAAVLTQSFNAN